MIIAYRTILADPPWNEEGGGRIRRGASRHYRLLKTPEIIGIIESTLEGKVGNNAHMYLWVTNNFLPDGIKVLIALNFRYITTITWLKDRFGLGQYYRGITEHCLFGVKGVLPYKILDGKRSQGVTGFFAPKTIHSEKPAQIYEMIEKVSYAPFLEMFARKQRPGWDTWGLETQQTMLAAPVIDPASHCDEGKTPYIRLPQEAAQGADRFKQGYETGALPQVRLL